MPPATASDRDALHAFDDLRLVSNDLTDADGFTLTAVVRNEMFFMPAFLAHYRALGVERFVFLDDHSSDGTRAFLADQADCMVVESGRQFADRVPIDHPMCRGANTVRVRNVWINVLLQRFALDRWSLHVDADEFLRIPEGRALQDIVADLDAAGEAAVCCVMLDMYPAHIADLAAMKNDEQLRLDDTWYYDGRQHFALPSLFKKPGWSQPSIKYPGARARLMRTYRIRVYRGMRWVRSWYELPHYHLIRKPVLLRLSASEYFVDSHRTSARLSDKHVLPLEHFKFSGQLFARAEAAIQRGSHHRGSVEYHEMTRLLDTMSEANASFLCDWSSSDRSFDAYLRNGVALGFGDAT